MSVPIGHGGHVCGQNCSHHQHKKVESSSPKQTDSTATVFQHRQPISADSINTNASNILSNKPEQVNSSHQGSERSAANVGHPPGCGCGEHNPSESIKPTLKDNSTESKPAADLAPSADSANPSEGQPSERATSSQASADVGPTVSTQGQSSTSLALPKFETPNFTFSSTPAASNGGSTQISEALVSSQNVQSAPSNEAAAQSKGSPVATTAGDASLANSAAKGAAPSGPSSGAGSASAVGPSSAAPSGPAASPASVLGQPSSTGSAVALPSNSGPVTPSTDSFSSSATPRTVSLDGSPGPSSNDVVVFEKALALGTSTGLGERPSGLDGLSTPDSTGAARSPSDLTSSLGLSPKATSVLSEFAAQSPQTFNTLSQGLSQSSAPAISSFSAGLEQLALTQSPQQAQSFLSQSPALLQSNSPAQAFQTLGTLLSQPAPVSQFFSQALSQVPSNLSPQVLQTLNQIPKGQLNALLSQLSQLNPKEAEALLKELTQGLKLNDSEAGKRASENVAAAYFAGTNTKQMYRQLLGKDSNMDNQAKLLMAILGRVMPETESQGHDTTGGIADWLDYIRRKEEEKKKESKKRKRQRQQ